MRPVLGLIPLYDDDKDSYWMPARRIIRQSNPLELPCRTVLYSSSV